MQTASHMSKRWGSDKAGREGDSSPGCLRRYRLPLLLAVIAVALYAGSILYILFIRVPVA